MIRSLLPLLGLPLLAIGQGAPPAHDFYVCANINRDYVIGSKIVTLNGTYQRDPASGAWRHFGINDTTISALAFDPRDRNVMFTTTLNGFFGSRDGGVSWRMLNDWTMTEGRSVAVDRHAPDHVYVALTDGIVTSRDGGHTWTRRENGMPERGRYTQAITVDRTTAHRVMAGTEKGVFLTTDAGDTWHRVLVTATTVNDVQQSPHDAAHWIAVTDTHGAWASRDGGTTWARLDGAPGEKAIYNVAFDPTHAQRIVLGGWHHGVWTSEDGGATWTARNAGLPDGARAWRVGVEPDRGRLYASIFKETLFYSDDFGRTWQPDAALAGSQVHAFVTPPRAQP